MTTPFRTTRRVEFAETDMAGIVHFSNFFRYMEAAEVEFLRSLDWSVSYRAPDGQRYGFPRVSATCDYMKPATFADLLEVTVAVLKVGRKSVTYRFEFFKQGALIARGQVSSVCCRVVGDHELESIEIPDVLRSKLEQAIAP